MDSDSDRQDFSLRQALVLWCEPYLVARVRDLEVFAKDEDLDWIQRPRLGGNLSIPVPEARVSQGDRMRPRVPLFRAWKDLLRDFQRQIERGQILLMGVSTWPVLETERRAIPGHRAKDFCFDFVGDGLHVQQLGASVQSYVAVRASLLPSTSAAEGCPATPAPDVAVPIASPAAHPPDRDAAVGAMAPVQAGVIEIGGGAALALAAATQTGGAKLGRENYEPLILEALQVRLDSIGAQEVAPQGWSVLAKVLQAWLVSKYPERRKHKRLPSAETIRIRLPGLYQYLTDIKSVR